MLIDIVSIYALNAGSEICVSFEITSDGGDKSCRESFIISAKQYLTMSPAKGRCTEEQYDEIAYASEVWGAVKKGTSLLGYGACSKKAMRIKLVSKGFSKAVADEAVAELIALGFMRPAEDALREAQRLSDKLFGKKRIVSELYEKGYDAEAVTSALNELENMGVDYVENCRKFIFKRYGDIPEDEVQRRKFYAALQRYGYTISDIRDAIQN